MDKVPCEKDNKQTKNPFLLQAGLVLSHCQALLRSRLFPEALPLLCESIRYNLFNFQIWIQCFGPSAFLTVIKCIKWARL